MAAVDDSVQQGKNRRAETQVHWDAVVRGGRQETGSREDSEVENLAGRCNCIIVSLLAERVCVCTVLKRAVTGTIEASTLVRCDAWQNSGIDGFGDILR